MGRYYWNKKDTVEDCKDLSVQWLKKHDYLQGFKYGGIKWRTGWGNESSVGFAVNTMDDNPYLKFDYTITDRETGEKTDYDYKVRLTTTPCNYGGVRCWFICPLVVEGKACNRRVGTLYLAPSGKYFGCRHCYDLSYNSRNESYSGKFAVFRKVFDGSEKLDKLRSSIGFNFRAGKPTKKFLKALNLTIELNKYSRLLDRM